MIHRIVKMTFTPDNVALFLHFIDHKKKEIAAFEGCLSLEILQDRHLPYICFTYSIWKDETALENYRNSDLFAETWKKTKTWFGAKPEAWSTYCLYKSENI